LHQRIEKERNPNTQPLQYHEVFFKILKLKKDFCGNSTTEKTVTVAQSYE